MSWGRHSLVFVVGVLACISCGDDDSADGGAAGAADSGGEATAGKSGGSFSTAGSHGGGTAGSQATGGEATTQAGSPPVGGATGAGGSACQGDAARWATITSAAPACKTAADCCVVVNSCLAEAQIVGAKDFAAAKKAWPYCADDCTDCIPPAVVVACNDGHCVGTADAESGDEGVSHCGDVTPLGDAPAQSFSCQ